MIVYTNGCSYAVVSNGKRYSEFLAESLGAESVNAAVNGSCNDRILRSSLRDLINLKKQHDDIVAVISLSFILRTELWNRDSSRQDQYVNSGDGDFASYQFTIDKNWFKNISADIIDAEYTPKKCYDYGINWLMWFDVEAETTKLLQQVLLFTHWCKYNNVKYVIFSGPLQEPVSFDASFISPFYEQLQLDSNVINMFEKSFTEWCDQQGYKSLDDHTTIIHDKTYNCGHQGQEAHRAWADHLLKNYIGNLS